MTATLAVRRPITPTEKPVPAAELVAEARRHLAETGHDPATILAAALQRLAEQWADNSHPLCRECNIRRVARGGGTMCAWCLQSAEAQRLYKRAWWDKAGNDWRQQWRAQAEAGDDEAPE